MIVYNLSLSNKIYLAFIAAIGAVALIGQLYLTIVNTDGPVTATIIQYFSYFTIQCNILVTVCALVLLLSPGSTRGRFFSKEATLAALTLYIVVVGITYNVILRSIWNPQGFQKLVDEMLHVIMPLLFVIYWLIFAPKRHLTWNIWGWLIYPFLYAVYVMIRGAISGKYPYPFLDAAQLGYPQALLNCGGMVILFLLLALLLVGVGKGLAGKHHAIN